MLYVWFYQGLASIFKVPSFPLLFDKAHFALGDPGFLNYTIDILYHYLDQFEDLAINFIDSALFFILLDFQILCS
jgi:hypothetical protein